ncbi:GNAT family N-acetyltransferase [Anaerosporobacter sp.]
MLEIKLIQLEVSKKDNLFIEASEFCKKYGIELNQADNKSQIFGLYNPELCGIAINKDKDKDSLEIITFFVTAGKEIEEVFLWYILKFNQYNYNSIFCNTDIDTNLLKQFGFDNNLIKSNNKQIENPQDIIIRLENEKDYRQTEELTRSAFWNVYNPGCNEHFILHELRRKDTYLPELHYVAEHKGKVIGSIVYCKGKIVDEYGKVHEVIGFGPISVNPEYQRDGIGSMLINHTKKRAKEMGFVAILICGNPDYYHRFGFRSASEYDITLSDGSSFDAFMVLELEEGALKELSGRYYEDDVFHNASNAEFQEYDKQFEKKVMVKTPTQL